MRCSRPTSGVLSSRDAGGAARHLRSSQPNDSSESQRAPERSTPIESARYTCSTAMFSQTSSSVCTPSPKLSARQASAVAFIAPAEVPQMMSNGERAGGQPASHKMRAIACSTPTW